jgi:putative sigma-54 modulation protein
VQVIISTRGLAVSDGYKDTLSRRLAKLERLVPKAREARVILSREKHRCTAALALVAKRRVVRSRETADDLAAAVDLAVAALGRQVRDLKERVKHKKPRRGRLAPALPAEPAPAPAAGEPLVRRMTPKPMSVEEAVEQFRLGRDQFLVFTNARTDAVNVLYRRHDGTLGLVEPVT